MSARLIVIDSSALLASHEREQHEELGRLHARSDIIAPVLLGFEVGHVVHSKKPEAFGASAEERAAFVDALLMGVTLVDPDEGTWRRVGALAEADDLSFYDAAFLELAIEREATLLTEDDRLAKSAVRRIGKTRVMRMTR